MLNTAVDLQAVLDAAEEERPEKVREMPAPAAGMFQYVPGEVFQAQRAATPTITVPDLTVVLVLGDPTDAYFMKEARGLSGNGSMTGYLMLTLWPTEENPCPTGSRGH